MSLPSLKRVISETMPLGVSRQTMGQGKPADPTPQPNANQGLEAFLASMKGKNAAFRMNVLKHIMSEMLESQDELYALIQDVAGIQDLNTFLASRAKNPVGK